MAGLSVLNSRQERLSLPPQANRLVIFTALWQLVIAVAALILAWRVANMPTLTILGKPADLGRPVQVFAVTIVLLPAVIAVLGSVQLLRGRNGGRYTSLGVNLTGLVLSLFALLGVWGVYQSYKYIVDALMANARLTLGFVAAYVLMWVSGRFIGRVQDVLERLAAFVASLTLIVLLLASNVLGAANYILSTYSTWQAWLFTAVTVIFGVLVWQLLKLADIFGERPAERAAWQGWFMLAPNIIGFVLFFAGPLLLSFYLSFTDSSVGQVPNVVWLDNYRELLSLQVKAVDDPSVSAQSVLDFGYAVVQDVSLAGNRWVIGAKDRLFWISLGNTFLFCLMLIPLAIGPALGMSLILNSALPGVKFFRALYFLPSVASVVGTALIWRWLYDPTIGYINYSLTTLNSWFGFAPADVQWLTNPRVVLLSVVILAAWQVVGYNTVLFLAGLQGVPNMLYEAAKIDGAGPGQRFLNVTLPMLAPTTFFVLITTMVTGLQVFNEPYALFPSRPIPEDATTLVYYLYTQGFNQFRFGYASSIAWVLFAIIFVFTFIQFRVNNSQAYG
ncbi:MAG: sugar ABC transporter permease [Deinococcota bacterium]